MHMKIPLYEHGQQGNESCRVYLHRYYGMIRKRNERAFGKRRKRVSRGTARLNLVCHVLEDKQAGNVDRRLLVALGYIKIRWATQPCFIVFCRLQSLDTDLVLVPCCPIVHTYIMTQRAAPSPLGSGRRGSEESYDQRQSQK